MSKRTRGQELVGITFNPSNNEKVDRIKQLMSEVIDEVDELKPTSIDGNLVKDRVIIQLLEAQMMAVKLNFME